jgi:hypothetical protein
MSDAMTIVNALVRPCLYSLWLLNSAGLAGFGWEAYRVIPPPFGIPEALLVLPIIALPLAGVASLLLFFVFAETVSNKTLLNRRERMISWTLGIAALLPLMLILFALPW